MRHVVLSLLFLAACGGGEEKKAATPPAPPAPAAAPAPAPAPTPAPPAAAPAPAGPYTPSDQAKAAYEKAKAEGADAKTNAKAGDAAAIAAGKTHYETKCAACHGPAGKGDGVAGAALPVKPANFGDPSRWSATSTGVKWWVVKNGIAGSAMAPLGLTDDQSWEVLSYIEANFAPKK